MGKKGRRPAHEQPHARAHAVGADYFALGSDSGWGGASYLRARLFLALVVRRLSSPGWGDSRQKGRRRARAVIRGMRCSPEPASFCNPATASAAARATLGDDDSYYYRGGVLSNTD